MKKGEQYANITLTTINQDHGHTSSYPYKKGQIMTRAETHSPSILIIDDEISITTSFAYALTAAGFNVIECPDPRNVFDILSSNDIKVVLLDIKMPHISGNELLPKILEHSPGIQVVMITGDVDIENAVRCMRHGAFDYLVKPVNSNRLLTTVHNAFEMAEVRIENYRLRQSLLSNNLGHASAFDSIITQDNKMLMIFKYIEAIGRTSLPVLITGETGTGKELIARSIHTVSGRTGQFVAVNVAGVDENLFCDTLFGHERGAFTGADKSRPGLIEMAADGTLFLDEIGELSMDMQVRILRLLQEKTYYPVGSDIARTSSCRIMAATNRNLLEMTVNNSFRSDLFYRLQYHQITLPPLRERRDDIELLVHSFITEASESLGIKEPLVNRQLFSLLNTYSFPGNIRELQAMVFDAVSRHTGGVLSTLTFKEKIFDKGELASQIEKSIPEPGPLIKFSERLPSLKETIDLLIQEALCRAKGNQTVASQLLGITRRALNNRLHRD